MSDSILFGPEAEGIPGYDYKAWQMTVFLAPNDWYGYAIGYIQVAGVLIEQLDANHPRLDRQTVILPIVYCYRHYIELTIKQIVTWSGLLLGEEALDATHDLVTLWNTAKAKLTRIHLSDPQSDNVQSLFPKIDEAILDFNQRDKRSIGFRYPLDKRGEVTYTGLININLTHLYDAMHTVYLAFQTIICEIAPYVEFRRLELEGPPDDSYGEEENADGQSNPGQATY